MGGTYEANNVVLLTVEQHAEAHRLLYEEHGKQQDWIAWKALSGQISVQEATKLAQRIAKSRKKDLVTGKFIS